MLRLLHHIVRRQFWVWDRPSQIAFVMAAALLVILLVTAFALPSTDRAPALVAVGAVLITLQLVVLWANRGMVTPYTRAQRYFLAEDFEASLRELEPLRSNGDANALTLLGNIYRQLGRLEESEKVLREALHIAPDHYFPLYGFGRTLLVKGDYVGAVDAFQKALAGGAPPGIRADLGESLYRLGDTAAAREALQVAVPLVANDPQRALMVNYLLYQLGVGAAPSVKLIETGLPYWQASAERFNTSPYGVTLINDVKALKQLAGEQ